MTFLHRAKEKWKIAKPWKRMTFYKQHFFFFLCHLNTGLGLVVQFMSCSALSFPPSLQSQPRAWLPPLAPSSPRQDRVATWALKGYWGFKTWEPLLVWMSHYSFHPQRIKVGGGLVALHSMTLFGSALHDSLNDASLLKFLSWVFLNSFKTSEEILVCNGWVNMSA